MSIRQKILLIITCLFLLVHYELYAQNGRVFGKVVDNNTGECLSNVSISLIFGNSTAGQFTTTVDGTYTFDITQAGNYQLKFIRAEYDDFSYTSFQVRIGESIRKDVPLQKPPSFLRITEVGNHNTEISVLNIGAITAPETYYVDFVNWGSVDIDYVTGKMCEWLTVSPSSGTLKPIGSGENESNRITIKINPDKFEAGKTTGKLLIITNNGNKVLDIKAIGKFPEIITLPPTPILLPQKFHCQINFKGKHTYKEMGYCFSDINSNPTVNDNVVLASTYHLSTYDYDDNFTFGLTDMHKFPWLGTNELFPPEFFCQTYYIRAFLKYENENNIIIYSDNVEKFTLMEFMCD